jgi:coenzyme F420 hydrogenase subunit beta
LFTCNLQQGRCYAACPKAEVDLEELARMYWQQSYQGSPVGRYEQALAARAGAKMPIGKYQGGGSVSALLIEAINRGLIKAAVLTGETENDPVPRLAENAADVIGCASSKFGAAPTLAALNRASAAGRRELGVVGTPCQVTALAKMRLNPLQRSDFVDPVSLVVGLFCNWSLDQRRIRAYLEERVNLSDIKGMDIPPPPANILRVDLGEKVLEIPLDEIRGLIPETCGLCPDMTAEWADVSVGMYEGRPGWNTILVRTPKGRDLVSSAVASGLLIVEPMPAATIDHLSQAAAAKKRRAFQAAHERGLINPADDGARAMLRVPADVLKEILGANNGGKDV